MVKIENWYGSINGFVCPICNKRSRRLIVILLNDLDFQVCNNCFRQILKYEMILNDKKEK